MGNLPAGGDRQSMTASIIHLPLSPSTLLSLLYALLLSRAHTCNARTMCSLRFPALRSSVRQEAGVAIHIFDFARRERAWEGCPRTGSNALTWCFSYHDRISASLVSQQLPHVYIPDAGDAPGMQAGFVLNPATLLNVLRCAWAVDVSACALPRAPHIPMLYPTTLLLVACGFYAHAVCRFPRLGWHGQHYLLERGALPKGGVLARVPQGKGRQMVR